jgi:hypothetical protein
MGARNTPEQQRAYAAETRKRNRDAGLVWRGLWVHPDNWPKIKKFADQISQETSMNAQIQKGEALWGKCRVVVYRPGEARCLDDNDTFPETKREGRKLLGLIDKQWLQIEILPWSDPNSRAKPGEQLPPGHPWAKPQIDS